MGFFNKFTFSELFSNKTKETEEEKVPEIPEFEFVETESMISEKELIEKKKDDLKKYEDKVRQLKLEIMTAKKHYQANCPHHYLSENTKKETSPSFNDFQFKCEYCGAELFDYNRALAYITTLMDLLSKASKMIEALNVNGIFINSSEEIYKDITKMITMLDNARSYTLNASSANFNNHLKDRVKKKQKKNKEE